MNKELSPAKIAALKKAQAARRNTRQNNPGVTKRELSTLLGEISTIITSKQEYGRISIRALAQHCKVSDRTVRRWLDGTDWPSAPAVRSLRNWLRSVK